MTAAVSGKAFACEMTSAAVAAVTVLRCLCRICLLHLQNNELCRYSIEYGKKTSECWELNIGQAVLAHLVRGCDVLPRPSALPTDKWHCGE